MIDQLLLILQGLRNRLGDPLPIRRLQDNLVAYSFLKSARVKDWRAKAKTCSTPADFYDLGVESQIFPSHQVKTEIVGFLEYARTQAPSVVVEIGTAKGGTQFLLSQSLPSVTTAVAVDLFVWNMRILQHFKRPTVRQSAVEGSSYAPETVQRVVKELDGAPIDLLFIDGDHSYDGARSDFEEYRKLVRDGGLIAFHDIVPDHKTRFGRDTGRWAGDVPVLWEQIKPHFEHLEFVEDTQQDGLGIGVIRHQAAVDPFQS